MARPGFFNIGGQPSMFAMCLPSGTVATNNATLDPTYNRPTVPPTTFPPDSSTIFADPASTSAATLKYTLKWESIDLGAYGTGALRSMGTITSTRYRTEDTLIEICSLTTALLPPPLQPTFSTWIHSTTPRSWWYWNCLE